MEPDEPSSERHASSVGPEAPTVGPDEPSSERHASSVGPDDLLAGHPVARAVYERVCALVAELGPFEVRTTKSQIAFRRRRGFAYLWLPGRYLPSADAEVVLSIPLGRHEESGRFKEVAHPAPNQWMHHLELQGPEDIDGQVVEWLREAAERAS